MLLVGKRRKFDLPGAANDVTARGWTSDTLESKAGEGATIDTASVAHADDTDSRTTRIDERVSAAPAESNIEPVATVFCQDDHHPPLVIGRVELAASSVTDDRNSVSTQSVGSGSLTGQTTEPSMPFNFAAMSGLEVTMALRSYHSVWRNSLSPR